MKPQTQLGTRQHPLDPLSHVHAGSLCQPQSLSLVCVGHVWAAQSLLPTSL